MKNKVKILASALAIGAYLLLAVATSTDDCCVFFTEGNIINKSDSCRVNRLRFVFDVSPTNADTVNAFPLPLLPGDTAFIFIDSLPYRTLLYDCICGDTLPDQSVPFQQGSLTVFPDILLDCD